jgi:hypothetical protein
VEASPRPVDPRGDSASRDDVTSNAPPVHILVVANETVGGSKLIDAIKARSERGPIRCTVVCPQNKPRKGYVIYDQSVRSAAQIRLEYTLERLHDLGIPAEGEVMDPDPFLAVQDAIRLYRPDEIIISTHPYPRSGWLRRDLVGRIRSDSKLPVEHVVVDLQTEPVRHTLVVANETVGGRKLIDALEKRASESPHRFTVICPQGGKELEARMSAEERLQRTLKELRQAGLDVAGQVMEGEPLAAIQNAIHYHPADEVIISTFPGRRSRWLRGDLINAVRRATGRRVEHIEVDPTAEPAPAEVAGATGH